MHRLAPIALRAALVFLVLAPLLSTETAHAFALRVPQVVFASGPVQQYLHAHDGHIDAGAHQLDLQTIALTHFGDGSERFELDRNTACSIGFYNATLGAGAPALFELFPPTAFAHEIALCQVTAAGALQVTRFDPEMVPLGTSTYAGFNPLHFGLYVSGPVGIGYMEDARNGGRPRVLSYAGTRAGGDYAQLYLCFGQAPGDLAVSTFFDAAVHYVPAFATPARGSTWGGLKAAYR